MAKNRLTLFAGPSSLPSTNFSNYTNHYTVTGGAASITIAGVRCAICPVGDTVWINASGGTAVVPSGGSDKTDGTGSFPIPDSDRRLFEIPSGTATISWIASSGTAKVGVEIWDS